MKTKQIAIALMIMLLLAGCGGGKYAEEKAALATVTKAMESFTSSIKSADDPDDVAKVIGTFTDQFGKIMPKLKELSEAHPEWENDPPEELKDAMDKLKEIGEKMQTETMPKIMKMASEHADHEGLQTAIQKFSGVMMGM